LLIELCDYRCVRNGQVHKTLGELLMSVSAAHSPVSDRRIAMSELKFDYGSLSPSVEKFLRGQADRIRRQYASSIIQIGKALLEAKRHLSHGAFLRWVECEVGVPSRTAQAYMRAAQWAAGKSASVAHLPTSAIYMLSANGVPETFVVNILERVEAGERIGAATIREELRTFQQNRIEKSIVRAFEPVPTHLAEHDAPACPSIAELAAFLSLKLSAQDFARVCQMLTSDSVLSDPDLVDKLERQFRPAGGGCSRGEATRG
jgi:hypothetical protein